MAGDECLFDALEGDAFGVKVGVLVELLSGAHVGVAEDRLGIRSGDAQALQERRGGVSGVMHGDAGQADLLVQLVEGAGEVAWFDGRAVGRQQNELIGRRRTGWVIGEGEVHMSFGSQVEELLTDRGQQRQDATSGRGLDRALSQLAGDALKLLFDVDLATDEVDIAPAQAEHLAAAHAVQQQELVADLPTVTGGGVQEQAGLLGRPGSDRLAFVVGQVHQPGDVAEDEFFLLGAAEGRGEHLAHLVDGSRRAAVLLELVDRLLDIHRSQLRQQLLAQIWGDVQADRRFVQLDGARPVLGSHHVLQPVLQVAFDRPLFGGNRHALTIAV